MTSEELTNILAVAATIPALKSTVDAAGAAYENALANAQNAKAAWLSAVDAGDNVTALTALANQYVATAVAQAVALAAYQAAGGPRNTANETLEAACQAAIYAALHPEQ